MKANKSCIPINLLSRIKKEQKKGLDAIWVCDKGREGVIFPKKYGEKWWERAKKSDIRRVMVR